MIARLVVDLVARGTLSPSAGAAVLVELEAFDGLDVAIILLSIALGAYLGATT